MRRLLFIAIVGSTLALSCSSSANSQIELCGIDQNVFRRLAFTSALGPGVEGKIVKWSTVPGFAILSRRVEPDALEEINFMADKVSKSLLSQRIEVQIFKYTSYAQARVIVEGLDRNTVIALVDDRPFDSSSPMDAELSQILQMILIDPRYVEPLISDARANKSQHAMRSTIDLRSGEVVAAVSLINANMDAQQISAAVFASYFTGLSPSVVLSGTQDVLALMDGVGSQLQLTELGKIYYGVLNNPDVRIGSTDADFIGCPTTN